jgi:hypothetical protein
LLQYQYVTHVNAAAQSVWPAQAKSFQQAVRRISASVYTHPLRHYICLGAVDESCNIASLLLWQIELIQRCT